MDGNFNNDQNNTNNQYNQYNYQMPNMEAKPQATIASYITGIIGALIGAIIGSLPWLIVLQMGWMVGWLAFLVGFFSLLGYKILKGAKVTWFANVAVFATSIIVIIAMNFVYLIIEMDKLGMPITMDWIKTAVEIVNEDGGFTKDIIMSLVIGIIGLIGINKQVSQYTNPVKDVNNDGTKNIEM